MSGGNATHVPCPGLALGNDVVNSLADAVGVVVKTKVTKHHAAGENEGSWVGLVLALDVETNVTAARLEDGDITSHVAARNDTWTTDKTGTDVGQDTTVKVGHDHDVELLRTGDTLHGGVVDNHVVGLNSGVLLTDLLDSVAEQTIGKLHDVGLVDAGNLAAVVGQGEREGELGDALRLGTGDDLERLDDAGNRLVLEARVLALGVLTDDAKVDILVAGLVTGDVLDQDNGRVNVELLAEGDVERLVAGALDGSVEDTLETNLVALQRGDGLAEELLGVLVASLNTGDVDLLPLDGHVVGLEDGLDRLGDLSTNTVTCDKLLQRLCPQCNGMPWVGGGCMRTWDKGDSVLAAELGGLEDVGGDSRVSCSRQRKVSFACWTGD